MRPSTDYKIDLTDIPKSERREMKKTISPILLTSVLIGLILSVSCANKNPVISKELQNSVPFQIIIPSYLPNDIKNSVPILEGPWVNSPSANVTSLQVVYNTGGSANKSIIIDEQNLPVYGELVSGDTIFILNNIQIEEGPFYTSGAENLTGSMYTWNSGNLNFIVQIVGYSETESRKIIRSMIQ